MEMKDKLVGDIFSFSTKELREFATEETVHIPSKVRKKEDIRAKIVFDLCTLLPILTICVFLLFFLNESKQGCISHMIIFIFVCFEIRYVYFIQSHCHVSVCLLRNTPHDLGSTLMNKVLKEAPEDVPGAPLPPLPAPVEPPPETELIASSSKGVVGEEKHQEPVDGADKPNLSSSSSSSKETAKAQADTNGNEPPNMDITSTFLPPADSALVAVENDTAKNRFLHCDFAMPGIALKKFASCSSRADCDISSYVAAFGEGSIRMYKKEKATVKGFIMGDYMKDTSLYWELTTKHLKGKKCAGLCFFDVCAFPVEQVRVHLPWLVG